MTSCTVENWTVESLAAALQDMHKDNKRIAVPMFQRGQRWDSQQQRTFIDSLIKGFPVGTMLFFETFDSGKQTYILVDGLQRGNSIKKYMNNPTEFFYDKNISDDFCRSVLRIVSADVQENYGIVRNILTGFIKEQKSFKNLQYYTPAKDIADKFEAGSSPIGDLIDIIAKFFEERQALYEQISMTVIPIIVYHGNEENLPEIFDRINSQGTPLDQYEVYAAAWPVNRRFKISNSEIVECAIKKYDAFVKDGFIIHGYDRETMRQNKKVNAFEYLFGLSKYLVNKYDVLGFQKGLSDDTVNPLGFELVNACLNDTDRIKSLYQNIYDIEDIDAFEHALYTAIEFVVDSISSIIRFKGNSRSGAKLFHSKFQILSMISTTFKEMYKDKNYNRMSEQWNGRKDMIAKNLSLYYVYDIITDYWHEGGTNKIHSAAKPNRYAQEISPRAWRTALDGFYERSMFRSESKQVQNPKSGEYVILNCIYLSTFTAMDQLSIQKFDVEHIAPKKQMMNLIATTNGTGLPISCIANLCYLPEMVNRVKQDRNFYQDKKYLQHIDLKEVETKYSFTTEEDLEWMDMPYEGPDDYNALKQFYVDFCNKRFEIMKRLFCSSMDIDYDAMNTASEESSIEGSVAEGNQIADNSSSREADINLNSRVERASQRDNDLINYCVEMVERTLGEPLFKSGRSIYLSADGTKGFIVCVSKAYPQSEREKYWFAYRKNALESIKDCTERYIIYICKDSKDVVLYPVEEMERIKDNLNSSVDDEGNILHWHVVFFRDGEGNLTQLLSRPELEEININKYRI